MLNDKGDQNIIISPTTSIQIETVIPVVRIWSKELFITWICWLRWLAWWSIIKKVWLRRLFGINTIFIVSKTSIGNAATTRRLIVFIGITSSVLVFEYPFGCIFGNRSKSFLLKALKELSQSLKLWYDLASTLLKYDLDPIPKFYKCSSIWW